MSLSADQIIDAQILAYNQKDLEKFLSFYSDSVLVFKKNEAFIEGKEELKSKYRALFEQCPNLHAEVVDRLLDFPWVTDREKVTGLPGQNSARFFRVRSKVVDSLITEVHMELEEE